MCVQRIVKVCINTQVLSASLSLSLSLPLIPEREKTGC